MTSTDEPQRLGRMGRAALISLGACGGASIGSMLEEVIFVSMDFDWGMTLGLIFGAILGLVLGRYMEKYQGRETDEAQRMNPLSDSTSRLEAALPWLGVEANRDAEVTLRRVMNAPLPPHMQRRMLQYIVRAQLRAEEQQQQQHQPNSMVPASAGLIRALPIHKVTAEEASNAAAEHKSCTICIEDFCQGEEQMTLPCFHRFHAECVDPWLRKNGSCPVCKHRVDADLSSHSA